ncbi:MAG TPA: endo-1,4-beta-xylanase [Opitutaceae bacterium]|nr:endo-1,4-beta-xylanase [Opitutaceae bacterium]
MPPFSVRFRALCGWLVVLGLAGMVRGQSVPSGGVRLIAPADLAVQGNFWQGSTTGGAVASRAIVPVTGQTFTQAARVSVVRPTGDFWASAISAPSTQALEQGDVVLIHLFIRAIETQDETGSVFMQVYAEGPAPAYSKSLSQQISAGLEWREYFLPFAMAGGFPAGQFTFNLGFGASSRPQVIEVGGVEVLGYGKTRTLAEMPRTSFTYEGRALDAPWRKAAQDRIERMRKATYGVRVVNTAGVPVPDARVRVRLDRHAFGFGTAFVAARVVNQTTSDNRTYLQKLTELFHAASTENDLKWPPWEGDWGSSYSRPQTLAALQTLKQQGLALRGHVLVWPSERNLPNSIKALLPTRDPSVPAKVLAHIDDVVTATKDLLGEWDVLNEPYDNHDLMDFYGSSVMADWFRRAHERHPAARLYINDYSILSGGGLNVAHQNHYEQTIRTILNAGAPLHGIGFQGHFEGAPTGMQKVWSLLERYSGAFPGVVFKITEFDVDTEDEALQADYTRDLLTLVFSHPQAAGFQVWGFWEGSHWRPRAAMYRRDWTEKPNGKVWRELINGTWRTDDTRMSERDGTVSGRGFLGTYTVEVEAGGKTVKTPLQLGTSGGQIDVVIDVAMNPAPRVVQEPLGLSVAPGESATLRVEVAGDPAPTVTWYREGVALGRTGPELVLSPTPGPVAGSYAAEVSNRHGVVWSRTARVAVRTSGGKPGSLINLSSRGLVRPGDSVMIAGFVLEGTGKKAVLIRAIGPRLAQFGVPGTLADPRLRIFRAGSPTPLAENDTWSSALAPRFAEVGAFSLEGDAGSAALWLELDPGAYTAQLDGADGGSGVALIEVYDAGTGRALELKNLSTRAVAGAGETVLIAGLVVTGDAPVQVLLRGIGPGLANFGVAGVLSDPVLRIFESLPQGGSRLLAVNDDWGLTPSVASLRTASATAGAFAVEDWGRDASLLLFLEPGAYTVHLAGAGSTAGVALLEAYALP